MNESQKYRSNIITIILISALTLIPFIGLTDFNTKGEPREAIVAFTMLDTNNWILPQNNGDDMLFSFPQGAHVMDPKAPYMELVAGVHNIFKFFAVDFVHRFNYNGHADTKKNGIRFGFMMSF